MDWLQVCPGVDGVQVCLHNDSPSFSISRSSWAIITVHMRNDVNRAVEAQWASHRPGTQPLLKFPWCVSGAPCWRRLRGGSKKNTVLQAEVRLLAELEAKFPSSPARPPPFQPQQKAARCSDAQVRTGVPCSSSSWWLSGSWWLPQASEA